MDTRAARPEFLVAGVAKCGTTSVHQYLAQHPGVFVPQAKESFFFVSDVYKRIPAEDPHGQTIRGRTIGRFEEYLDLFAGRGGARVAGEVATFYAYHHASAIPRIRECLGDAAILILLRNPVERAHSAYWHFRGYGLEKLSFEEALDAEDTRMRRGWYTMWYYRHAGLYAAQVKAFRGAFSRVKVCLADDLERDGAGLMRDVYGFLGADASFRPDVSLKYMVSGSPRSAALNKLVSPPEGIKRWLRPLVRRLTPEAWRHRLRSQVRMRNLAKPAMEEATRRRLCSFYASDVAELGALLNRDVSHWLAHDSAAGGKRGKG